MLNQATVTYTDNTIKKISVERSKLPQYWLGVKKALSDYYKVNQFKEYPDGTIVAVYGGNTIKLAIRHIIDWETIERYWKKLLKEKPIVLPHGESAEFIVNGKINSLLASNKLYKFTPHMKLHQQPVPPNLVPDNQLRFTMNVSLMFCLLMNDISNLFLGEAGYNSSLGSKSSNAKMRLKANYGGEKRQQLGNFGGGDMMGIVQIHKESKQHAALRVHKTLGGNSELPFENADEKTQTQLKNYQSRFDRGEDDDPNHWGLDQNHAGKKFIEFKEMWPIAWGKKDGKYGIPK